MRQFANLVNRKIRPEARKRGFSEAQIFMQWRKLVPEFGDWSSPHRLYKGTLTIGVASSAVAQNIQMISPQIISRLNGFFGYEAVNKIKFINRHVPEREHTGVKRIQPTAEAQEKATKRCENVRDEDLRAILEKLGALVEMEEFIKKRTN